MRITNNQNLPAPLVRAVSYSDRQRGDAEFTVTELVQPPRIGALMQQHWDDLEEDASDRLWMLMGSAAHEVLRRSAESGIVEKRLSADLGGCKISGQVDLIDQDIIDYKLCSLWAAKDGVKPEWEAQVNCYRWLAIRNGIVPNKQFIIAIFRDWSLAESKRNSDYPKHQVLVMPVTVWSMDVTEEWVTGRINAHTAARKGNLPECTAEEMWERPAVWAVKKKGGVRAVKLHHSEEFARLHAAEDSKLEVEFRPGQRPRCENYCAVSEFCDQYKKWKGQLL